MQLTVPKGLRVCNNDGRYLREVLLGVCLIMCDRATSRTWRRRPNLGCSATEKYAVMNVKGGPKGQYVADHRSAHPAGECVLLKPEERHLFLPSPMHACPRHGPRATSSDG